MALGDLRGLRTQPDPFEVLEGEEFERDLKERKGGLLSNRQADRRQIEELKAAIVDGSLTDEQAQAKIQRNPGAATELMGAFQSPERQIGAKFFNPGSPETTGPEPFGGVGPRQVTPAVPAISDFQGAELEALNRGRPDLASQFRALSKKDDKAQRRLQKLDDRQFNEARKLRQEHTKLSKRFIDVRDSFGRILESKQDPSAAGDLSLIFNYMKMLDPESVVRESEFATAENSGSVPDRIIARYNKVREGQRLSPNQRADFFDRAKRLHNRQLKTQRDLDKRFKGLSKRFGIPSDLTVQDFSLKDQKPQQSSGELTPEEMRELEELRRIQR